MNQDDLRKAAKGTYLQLKEVFSKSGNYWRLGHAFDTIIDYFVSSGDEDGEAAVFGKLALERYRVTQGAWYDDFGWWAIANLRAAEHDQLFGDDSARFLNNCLDGWNRMAPCTTVWEQDQKIPGFQVLKPAVEGGAWNCANAPGNNSTNPLNPNGNPLGGFQNTVTNSLRLVLSTRLARHIPNIDQYKVASDAAYHFMSGWLSMSRPGFEPLLNVFSSDGKKAVVRERVSCYDSGVKLRGYRSDLAWTGDQGLVIGGMIGRMAMVTKSDPDYPAMLMWVRQILAGVPVYLARDGLLLPWSPDPAPGGDPEDYRTGLAVYMRYLLYVYLLQDEDLLEALSPYKGFVYNNANQVLQHPANTTGNIDDVMGLLTNDLAILSAALVIG
jgi:hypothetical protein